MKTEHEEMAARVEKLEKNLRRLSASMNTGDNIHLGNNGAGQESVDRLESELAKLRNEFEPHAEETDGRLSTVEGILPTKADKSDLLDLQNALLSRFQEMLQSVHDRFVTKEDFNRRLGILSKKIKELYDLLSGQNLNGSDETAMLSKKQIGPMACASCEKNLVNLEALQADYTAWRKLPFRDPSERIARYGPGFSRILMSVGENSQSPTGSPRGHKLHTASVDDGMKYDSIDSVPAARTAQQFHRARGNNGKRGSVGMATAFTGSVTPNKMRGAMSPSAPRNLPRLKTIATTPAPHDSYRR